MTIFDSLIHDLQELPLPKLMEVVRYVHTLNPQGRERRFAALQATAGCLSDEEGKDFEESVRAEADRMDSNKSE